VPGDAVTHYDVLGVAPDAPPDELHDAYVALARRHHPDRSGGDAVRMRAINAAWATLGDPARRARYDLSLAGTPPDSRRPSSMPDDDVEVDDPWSDGDDLWRDLADDRPFGLTVVLPRWLSLVPVATFAASVVVGCLGVILAVGPMIGLAFVLFLLASLFFLSAPFAALLLSRRGTRGRRDPGPG